MDYLKKEGIGLRAMAQRDPVIEYQRGTTCSPAMLEGIRRRRSSTCSTSSSRCSSRRRCGRGQGRPRSQVIRRVPSRTRARAPWSCTSLFHATAPQPAVQRAGRGRWRRASRRGRHPASRAAPVVAAPQPAQTMPNAPDLRAGRPQAGAGAVAHRTGPRRPGATVPAGGPSGRTAGGADAPDRSKGTGERPPSP
ncbi:hypothetical protein HBB16_11990 [Pseudonocardia sp. MCCB 268]|nr:hypothetical protein [Pseudonocardia cytotoxica]